MQQSTGGSKTAWMRKGVGEIVHTIPSTSIKPGNTKVSSELGFEVLCSYNWQKDGKTILVPGGPPKWTPPPLPVTLTKDSGYQFVDQNAFRVPRYPFEPALQALSVMNPHVQLDEIDIILNRNSLRKLLDFAAGKRQDPFRMDLHMVKDTLFISRKERNARLMIYGAANSGYGHNFENAFTKPEDGLDHSSSHHRVIRYHLGHLNCVVRFEVDAYYEGPDDANSANAKPQSIDHVTTLMAHLTANEPQLNRTTKGSTNVTLQGTPISSSKLAEIKARKFERINGSMPQLWFGRTPYLLTGKHINGVVHSVSCSHVGLQFTEWETANQDKLCKLVSLLAELKRIVRETGEGAAILLCEHKGAPIQIFKAKNEKDVLPRDIIKKHWDLCDDEAN